MSWDQKPAWFNNTALDCTYSVGGGRIPLIRDIEAQSRQRFTICTCVDSRSISHKDEPPPLGILFKAAPLGQVWRELNESPHIPPWMHVQTQVKGSYRASDMVELLGKTLPFATEDYDAIIVPLDWYAAHRDPAVLELIEQRGHVLLLHGGGTTAYEQVNDTHLHATLQACLKELEVAVFYGQLKDLAASGLSKACSHTRHDLCMLVKAVWENLNHEAISHKGYTQTGPLLPLTGPIHMADLCRDLRELVKEMCPHPDPEQVGTQIRDEARYMVHDLWQRQVHSWSDYRLVLTDHADHSAHEEGEEAMPWEV